MMSTVPVEPPSAAFALRTQTVAQHYSDVIAHHEARIAELRRPNIARALKAGRFELDISVEELARSNAQAWHQAALKPPSNSPSSTVEDGVWNESFPPSAAYISGSTSINVRGKKVSAVTSVRIMPAHLTLTVNGSVATQAGTYPVNIAYDPISLPVWTIAGTWDLSGANCGASQVQAVASTTHTAGWILEGQGFESPFSITTEDDDSCPHIPSSITVTFDTETIPPGGGTQAHAVARDANGAVIDCEMSFESGNPEVATVSRRYGYVNAVATYSYAPIIASCNERWGSAIVTIGGDQPPDGGGSGGGGAPPEPPPGGSSGGGVRCIVGQSMSPMGRPWSGIPKPAPWWSPGIGGW